MLSPDSGVTLIDALTPPEGYSLDIAVGTSFTLDLVALLAVPTAFALAPFSDTTGPDDRTPLSLLEALRAHAGRITIFSDRAHIALPSTRESTVLGFLDDVVVPVRSPHDGGLFHPKLWMLRYVDQAGTHVHRVLIPTRNLTFDRSWDTLVRLDEVTDPASKMPTAALSELGDVLRALPTLSIHTGPTAERAAVVEDLARTIPAAPFLIPEGFDAMRLHPLGFAAGKRESPLPSSARRVLVVSPFLGTGLPNAIKASSDTTVVSRAGELDRAFQAPAERPRAFILNPSAVDADGSDDESDGTLDDGGTGLHAKLFVHDVAGNRSSLFTGSANATAAAFQRNTEILLELRGPTSRVGVPEFLREPSGTRTSGQPERLRDLLVEHRWSPPTDDDATDEQETFLRSVQSAVAALRFRATVAASDDDVFSVEYSSDDPLPPLSDATLEVRPISQETWHSIDERVKFSVRVTLPQITRFLGVRLSLPGTTPITFAIPCLLIGAPENRSDQLLAHLIADPERLIRYLLMLLTDTPEDRFSSDVQGMFAIFQGASGDLTIFPLLELMLRAITHSPERIDSVGRLMAVVRENPTLADPDLIELWDSIAGAFKERR